MQVLLDAGFRIGVGDAISSNMASYKMTPLAHGEFLVEVDEGGDDVVRIGPYKSAAAARTYIEEHSRLVRGGKPRAFTGLIG